MLFSMVPISPQIATAATGGSDGDVSNGSMVHFDPTTGDLVTETDSKAASANVKYTTVKWIVRKDITCDGSDPISSNCSPLSGALGKDYIVLGMNDFDTARSPATAYKCLTASDTDCWYMKGAEKRLRNTFIMEAEKVDNFLRTNRGFEEVMKGTVLYFSAIFQVLNDPNKDDTDYNTLATIRSAEFWAKPEDFRQYYDRDAEYPGAKHYPLTVEHRYEPNNWTLKPAVPDITVDSTLPDKLWEPGKETKTITLSNAVTYSGQVMEIVCSYQQPADDTTNVPCNGDATRLSDGKVIKKGEGPYYVRAGNGNDFVRTPGMAIGGERVVVKYKGISCDCDQKVSIPGIANVGGKVEGSTLAQQVPLQINMVDSAYELQQWDKYLSTRTNIQVVVKLWRTDTGPNNTGAAPIWIKSAGPNFTIGGAAAVVNNYTKAQVMALLDGTVVPLYNDNLQSYPIPEGGKVSFRYNASVSITSTGSDGTVATIQCTLGPSLDAPAFFRPPNMNGYGTYTSEPQYWSEIKQGSPQTSGTGSDEQFEAMAGTPTTRQLYFSSGGSEFMVDIVTEYMPQTTATRSYRSHFTGVTNGWAMDPIVGGWTNDSPPAAPAARTMTDQCGQSKTETVTPKSQPYQKGTGPAPGYAPIMGTQYGWDQSGYSSHTVGDYTDTWSHTTTFDYMRIVKAQVWKLDKSKVDGMTAILGTNELTASVVQGDPSIFANIATANTSAGNRLRYLLEPNQHDAVNWEEGNSDNCHSNSKDAGPVVEQTKFTERRNLMNEVTAVSDVLILQTSSGDQSVMYFEKKSQNAKSTENLVVPTTNFDTMWTNNPLSAAKWDVHQIKIGGYNGQYSTPSTKYSGGSAGTVATIFDGGFSAGVSRPGRPSPYFRLMQTNLSPLNIPNGEYRTGNSSVFYKYMYNYNPNNWPVPYSTTNDVLYNAVGQQYASAYSSGHAKVNDIVIHNPVSVEDALVVSLPSSLDQRTPASKTIGGNLQQPEQEFETQLDPNYRQNILTNGDAEIANPDATVAGWSAWSNTGDSNIRFTSRVGDMWVMNDTRSFEINTTPAVGGAGTQYIGVYYKDVPIKPNVNYSFDGRISCHRCEGYFYLDVYNSDGSVYQSGLSNGTVQSTGTPTLKTINFKSGPSVNRVRIHIVKGNGMADSVTGVAEYVFADNLRLRNMDVQEFISTDPVYVTHSMPNPDYVPASTSVPVSSLFGYTGAAQTFTAPRTGTYRLHAWGAEGGYYTASAVSQGGYAAGDVALNEGDVVQVYVGGKGGNSSSSIDGSDSYNNNGGWNGGGSGVGSAGPGGGGGTDFRFGAPAETAVLTYNFDNTAEGFFAGSTGVSQGATALLGTVSAYDGYFYGPYGNFTYGKSGDILEIRVKNNSPGTEAQIYWSPNGSGFSDSYMSNFTMTANDADYKTYRIPVGQHAYWNNYNIYQMRFDLANGANSGSFDVDYIKVLTSGGSAGNRVLVAGGGGGNSVATGSTSYGGLAASTATLFQGENGDTGRHSSSYPNDEGGGGGGYYGGAVVHGDDPRASYGGTSWTGTLGNPSMIAGNASMPAPGGGSETGHTGNGAALITAPGVAVPAQGNPTINVQVVAAGGSATIPADAYIKVPKASDPNAGAGGFSPGNFILLDYGFQLYFPNTGDFYGNGANGISSTTSVRGKGFVDNMDTTEWTKEKFVKFQFDVIFNGTLYKSNTWIQLNVPTTTFDFYTPLENKEKISALVEWKSTAINGFEDNDTPTNRVRYNNYAARHSTLKRFNIDLVGRIGNMMMEDTGDFRFSNFFKMPAVPADWLIPNVVPKVDPTRQNFIVGDRTDIRANPVSSATNWLDTWGLLTHARQNPVTWPLSPEKNNIPALRNQPMRIGYNAFTDIQTIGNYYSNVQIIPYYYALNLQNGSIQQVDIYMNLNGSYKPINKFGAAVPGWDPTTVYQNLVAIDWGSEASRRNVTSAEQSNTDAVTNYALGGGGDDKTGKAAGPSGNYYAYGTNQIMYLNGRNRTYIGQTSTYGIDKNPGNKIPSLRYAQQAQRWHFHMGLPSSAVAVPKGTKPTQANMDLIAKNTMVLLMAADIKAVGDTYVLQYTNPNGNGTLNIAGTSWPLTSVPYPVVDVYSSNKSSAKDLNTFGSH